MAVVMVGAGGFDQQFHGKAIGLLWMQKDGLSGGQEYGKHSRRLSCRIEPDTRSIP